MEMVVTDKRSARASLWIGELACRAGTSADTVRYYERLGLVRAPHRSPSGYRLYSEQELGRLQFILRARRLGLSLDEIHGLLGLAEEGDCRPLRGQVVTLLRRKMDECDARLAELTAFRASLEERYRLARAHEDQPTCHCAAFPASCACLPISIEELTTPHSASTRLARKARRT